MPILQRMVLWFVPWPCWVFGLIGIDFILRNWWSPTVIHGERVEEQMVEWSAPDLVGRLHDEAELRGHVAEGETVALYRRRKATLGGQTDLIERDVLTGLVDTALELVLRFERSALGGDEPEDDHLALGHEALGL